MSDDERMEDREQENPFDFGDQPEQKKVAKRAGGARTFNETDLCEKPTGMNELYTALVLHQDKLSLRGKGHEMADFSKLMAQYRKWHL
jgi:hypothetical protein